MLNKIQLIGHLGQDPDVRSTQTGKSVANFSVATTERWKDQQGQKQERTEWHRIVAWGILADNCGKYIGKGSKVYIEGKLQTRKWQDREGNDRWTTETVAQHVVFLDPKGARGGNGGGYGPDDAPPPDDDDVPF